MSIFHLLYKHEYPINDDISVHIPTVGEVLEHEDEYFSLVSMFTSTPYDMMVQLDDLGIDFTTINDYDLFLLLFSAIKMVDTSLIFGDFNLSGFEPSINTQNNMIVLRNKETGVIIDRGIYTMVASALRKINHLERTNKKPGNEEAKKYLIERTRVKMNRRRRRNKKEESQLESLIVALVCSEQFSYRYDEVLDLTLYQFNESVYQVIKKVDVNYKMIGVYNGTISAKDFGKDELNWLVHK